MSAPFQPLGCGLHGLQTRLPEHDEKERHMASARADASQRIVAALDAKGGMLTAAQLREELSDLEPGVRYMAVNHLKNTGVIESQGRTSNIIYSLVRSSALRADDAPPAAATAPTPTPENDEPPAPKKDDGLLVNRSRLLIGADGCIHGLRLEAGAPYAISERLDAIADDLQDALEDACRAQLPHALISALVTSSGALRRARKTLTA
ncbi:MULTISPECIES: hypothetical protein [Xanthomonas]|uniref:Uncharacterized protein n=2 Tax=Xanthomonas TaxID=338 RepID=A0A7Z7NJ60_XANCH|nr:MULTISPECIES: hypothetical protein [Xanthomonas]ATS38440.2 hypothetical protein XcfCFBP6988P_10140 [Xanthomonas citri pv. phaseoli var. fuscans]ATS42760.2 hypothetical protein XcfCFBP6989P_10345 [Xanthomonas citri pv. phaseoli var. fuscans]ATS46440.2 hypothetical protein XcfCFBP6990P_07010 [Xanthomonas citri pv. phaseoli var. fuscans]ATS83302.2 hypothetical protein XcfCFBP6991P_04455 [Xanthomonas citri pv. phaseoli var. fuscans]UZB01076.1 hypothetical protein OM946_07705 [Xanthomonas citri 